MNDKEVFDAWMQLANYSNARHDVRRSIEWKVSISLWTGLLGAVAAFLNLNRELPWWLLTGVVLLHGYWLSWVYASNKSDMRHAHHFHDLAELIPWRAGGTQAQAQAPAFGLGKGVDRWLGFLRAPPMATQLVMTACVAIAGWILTRPTPVSG